LRLCFVNDFPFIVRIVEDCAGAATNEILDLERKISGRGIAVQGTQAERLAAIGKVCAADRRCSETYYVADFRSVRRRRKRGDRERGGE
jgi:hypothetical protein